jgi:5-methyltetrahydrofolate--homocysteine methyltransferase
MDLVKRMTCGPKPLLWDGGVGTALIRRGLDLQQEAPETWLVRHPDAVSAVHAEFAAAGADVIQTNSFGLLRQMMVPAAANKLASPELSGKLPDFEALARQSVALAARGAEARPGGPAAIVATLGPTGLFGSLDQASCDPERLTATAAQLAAWFYAAGAQALHLETCYDPTELRAALMGARRGAPKLPLIASLTLVVGPSGLETPLGVPLSRMLRELQENPPDAVGVNCSLHARRMRPAVAALRAWVRASAAGSAVARLPILAQPQVDQPAPDCKRRSVPLKDPKAVSKPDGADFARDLLALLDVEEGVGERQGADAVGGCCGCEGFHLSAARAAIDCAF